MNTSERRDDSAEPRGSARERVMGFWDHLDELRGTIIKSGAVFLVFALLIGYYMTEFDEVLMWPLYTVASEHPKLVVELGTTSPMEGVSVILQLCFWGGLMLAAPLILFFVGQFVAPALTQREMKAVLPLCAGAFILFLSGAAFGFFLLTPSAMRMTIAINQEFGWAFRWTVDSYYTLLTRLVIGVGATFQFPLIIVLMVWLDFVSTAFLRKYRRHAVILIFAVAAIVTPSTDPFSQVMLGVPLYALYELAIVISARLERRRERSGATVLLALIALLPRRRPATGLCLPA